MEPSTIGIETPTRGFRNQFRVTERSRRTLPVISSERFETIQSNAAGEPTAEQNAQPDREQAGELSGS
jgi:hypothetical protein